MVAKQIHHSGKNPFLNTTIWKMFHTLQGKIEEIGSSLVYQEDGILQYYRVFILLFIKISLGFHYDYQNSKPAL